MSSYYKNCIFKIGIFKLTKLDFNPIDCVIIRKFKMHSSDTTSTDVNNKPSAPNYLAAFGAPTAPGAIYALVSFWPFVLKNWHF